MHNAFPERALLAVAIIKMLWLLFRHAKGFMGGLCVQCSVEVFAPICCFVVVCTVRSLFLLERVSHSLEN